MHTCRVPNPTCFKQRWELTCTTGRAIAQAVSSRLPTAAARVRSQVGSCGICGQSGTGAGFLRVLRFPLPILISTTAPYSSILRGWYNRPTSGRRTKWTLTPPQGTKRKITLKLKFIWLSYIIMDRAQLTPGFCGAQVRYISIYKLSVCKPNTHTLLKLFMPVVVASVTNTAPQLPYYFYSQTLFWLPTTFGRSCILP
jgi:hypothetical protein